MKYINKITHINATPEFLANQKNIALLEKMCKLAYNMKPKKKSKTK